MSKGLIPSQPELLLNKCRDATPEEVKEWEHTDFFRSGRFDPLVYFVVIPTLIQLSMFGFMLGIFWLLTPHYAG